MILGSNLYFCFPDILTILLYIHVYSRTITVKKDFIFLYRVSCERSLRRFLSLEMLFFTLRVLKKMGTNHVFNKSDGC